MRNALRGSTPHGASVRYHARQEGVKTHPKPRVLKISIDEMPEGEVFVILGLKSDPKPSAHGTSPEEN